MNKNESTKLTIDTIFHKCELSENEKLLNLKDFYDTANKIAQDLAENGVDTSNWFYTHEQIEQMKKDPKFIFTECDY